MTAMLELTAADPILGATRGQLESLQLERLRTTLRHAYANSAIYRRKFDAAGIHPDDLRSLGDLARFPFTTKADLRESYPFGFFCVPMDQVARVHAHAGLQALHEDGVVNLRSPMPLQRRKQHALIILMFRKCACYAGDRHS